jgi:hypothetical protein
LPGPAPPVPTLVTNYCLYSDYNGSNKKIQQGLGITWSSSLKTFTITGFSVGSKLSVTVYYNRSGTGYPGLTFSGIDTTPVVSSGNSSEGVSAYAVVGTAVSSTVTITCDNPDTDTVPGFVVSAYQAYIQ